MRGIAAVITLFMASILGGCIMLTIPVPEGDGQFAIYLPAQSMTPEEMLQADLQDIALQETPLISTADVVSYAAEAHEMELTREAYAKIQELEVPVSGTPFVVCVGRKPIYGGAFWSFLSSSSFDGIVIMQPLGAEPVIRIERGYPSPVVATGEDPRSHPEVLDALRRAGKLSGGQYLPIIGT